MRYALPRLLALVALAACGGSDAQPLASTVDALGTEAAAPEASEPGAMRVVSIAAGEQHSVAVLEDGSVWTWGLSGNGQLGREVTIDDYWLPRRVEGARGLFAAAGGSSSFVVDGDTLWSAGYNHDGRLGWGPSTDEQRFTAHPLPNVVALDSRGPNSYALRGDSTLWAWGDGLSGELGNGTKDRHQVVPVRVHLDRPVREVAAGGAFALARLHDGSVWAWGINTYGTLGTDSIPTLASTTQTTVSASGAVSVSASAAPVQMFSVTPVRVPLDDVVAIAAGERHALAVTADSTVWGWGHNGRGALGQTEHGTTVTTPVQIPGLSGIVAVAAGDGFSVALDARGRVWVCGMIDGAPGYAEPYHRVRRVPALSGITQIEAGPYHAFAVTASGELWGWGLSDQGQVGSADSEGETDWPPLRVTF